MTGRQLSRRVFLRRTSVGLAGAAAFSHFAAARVGATSRQLVAVDWGGQSQLAKRKAYYEPFSRETGIKVIETGPPEFGKLKAMVESGHVEWDLVVGPNREAIAGARLGLLEPLDYKVIDASGINPKLVNPYWVHQYSYSTVIAYNTKRYPPGRGPRSWREVWDVQQFPGPRALRNHPIDNLEAALMADGVPLNRVYPIDVDGAYRSLDRIKPHVRVWWKTGAQSSQVLVDGQVDVGQTWSGRVADLRKEGAPVEMEWNQGIIQWVTWFIPKGAKNKDAAMRLIAYSLQPKLQAEATKYVPYGPANREAFKYIDSARARELSTHPENAKLQIVTDGEWWGNNLEAMLERWNAWLLKG